MAPGSNNKSFVYMRLYKVDESRATLRQREREERRIGPLSSAIALNEPHPASMIRSRARTSMRNAWTDAKAVSNFLKTLHLNGEIDFVSVE